MARLSTEYLRGSILSTRTITPTGPTTFSSQSPTPSSQEPSSPPSFSSSQEEYEYYRREGKAIASREKAISIRYKSLAKVKQNIREREKLGKPTAQLQERVAQLENTIGVYSSELQEKKSSLGQNYDVARKIAPKNYQTGKMNASQGLSFVSSRTASQQETMRLAQSGQANYITSTGEVQKITYEKETPFSQLGGQAQPRSGITEALARKGLYGGAQPLAKATYDPLQPRRAEEKRLEFTAQYGYTPSSGGSVVFMRNPSPTLTTKKETAPSSFQEQRQQDIITGKKLFQEAEKTGRYQEFNEFIISRPVGIVGGLLERNIPRTQTFLAQRYQETPSRATKYASATALNIRNLGSYARTNSWDVTRDVTLSYAGGAIIGGAIKYGEAGLYAWKGAKGVSYFKTGTTAAFTGLMGADILLTPQGELGKKLPIYVAGGAGYMKGYGSVFPTDGIRAKTSQLSIVGTEERTIGNDIFIVGTGKIPVERTLYGKTTTTIETAQISGIKNKVVLEGGKSYYNINMDVGVRINNKDAFTSFSGKQVGREIYLKSNEGIYYFGKSSPIISDSGASKTRGNFIILATRNKMPYVTNVGGFRGETNTLGFTKYKGGVDKKQGYLLFGAKNTYSGGVSAANTIIKGGTRDAPLFNRGMNALNVDIPLRELPPLRQKDAFGLRIGKRAELSPSRTVQDTITQEKTILRPSTKNLPSRDTFSYLGGLPITTPRITPARSLRFIPSYQQKNNVLSATQQFSSQRYDTTPRQESRIEPDVIRITKPTTDTYKRTDIIYDRIPRQTTEITQRNIIIPFFPPRNPPTTPPPTVVGFGGAFGFGRGGTLGASRSRRNYGRSLSLYDVTFKTRGVYATPRGGFTGLEISRLTRARVGRKKR